MIVYVHCKQTKVIPWGKKQGHWKKECQKNGEVDISITVYVNKPRSLNNISDSFFVSKHKDFVK